jgi:hypothetical protein
MSITSDIQSAVDEWVASGGEEGKEQPILDILDSEEYRALPYLERNRPFLTSSKLKEMAACPYHAWLQYVQETPSPVEQEADYFVIGQAFDDILTRGRDYFSDHYIVGSKATKETKALMEQYPAKPVLTPSANRALTLMEREYLSREFFPKKPTKKNILFLLHGIPCKIELDHFDAEARRIGDVKTTSSITTFNPMSYAIQFGFYSLGIALKHQENVEVELYVVDKGSDFSRSHKWVFCKATLMQQHFRVDQLARTWKDCMETGIWPHVDTSTEEGKKVCWSSEYWSICPFCKQMEPTVL